MELETTDAPVGALSTSASLRVLHCEDSLDDAVVIERALRRWRPAITYRRVTCEVAFREALELDHPDLVLCDYTVPGFGGPTALSIARQNGATVPFIFVSGTIGEENAIDSLRQGATDYVLKDRLARLIPAVTRALREADLRRHEESEARALAHHRRLLACVLAALPDYVYAVDLDNRVIAHSGRAAELLRGESAASLENVLLTEFGSRDIDLAAETAENRALMATAREMHNQERRVIDADGAETYLNVSKTLLRDLDSGALCSLVAVARDVTERIRLERAVLDASERELRRIGSDLHDGLGQELTGLSLLLAVVERSLGTVAPHARTNLLRAQELLRHAMETARRLAKGRAPVDLEAAGLAAALATLAARSAEMFGVPVRFDGPLAGDLPVDPFVAVHLYRMAQEAIGNAARHGRADRIDVRLRGSPAFLLEIEDDGNGFDTAQLSLSSGMGLRLMHYRANIIGGSLTVTSDANGTRIRFAFPAPRPAA